MKRPQSFATWKPGQPEGVMNLLIAKQFSCAT